MKALFAPTLVRRIVAALLLAFALAWCAVATYTYVGFRASLKTNAGLRQVGRNLLDALADTKSEDLAANAVKVTGRQFNAARRQAGGLPGDLLFQLRSAKGRVLFSSPEIAGATLQGPADQVIGAVVEGREYSLFTGQSGRWRLSMAEPMLSAQWLARWTFDSLALPFLVAFPFALIPVWLAAAGGIRPLRLLGQSIERRTPGDLAPLDVAPQYAELTPLVAALERLLLQLRGKVERERSFVNDAAHELRTPLAVISAQAHALARSTEPAERDQAARHLQQAVVRGSHLVQQLLDLAAMDAATNAPSRSFDVADLTRQLLAQAMAKARRRGVELTLESPDELTLSLPVPLYESVLRNLLDNAIQHADGAGEVAVTLASRDGILRLTVADTGTGIPLQEQALVFERFYRGANASAAGTGLGLAIVRQACLRMRGDVSLRDGDAGGCVFDATMRPWSPS